MRLLNPCSSVNYPREIHVHASERVAGQFFTKLAHFGECANLRFESLIVLPLDLKFRL
jgi:hypothetical protein